MKIDSYDSIVRWSYNLASEWAKTNLVPIGINSSRKFDNYKREDKYLPTNFPRKPDDYFKKNNLWKGWNDFFGKQGIHSSSNFFNYEEASAICKNSSIKNSTEYRNWKSRPSRLPARPDQFYKEVWVSWQKFLGSNYSLPQRQVFSKLKESDVRIIKHQLNLGISGAVLAKTFGVSEMQISRIKKGANWTTVE